MANENTPAAATSEGGAGKTGEQTPAAKTGEQTPAGTPAAEKKDDGKPAATAEGKTGDKAGTQTEEPKVPEKYTFTVPDDDKPYVDQADLDYFEKLAKANKWTQEDADAALAESLEQLRGQADRYLAETKADKTYGGDKFDETQRLAKAVVDKIRPKGHDRRDSFLRFMGRGGAGNNLEVLSFLADLGKAMGEDTVGATRAIAGGKEKTAEEMLYGETTSKAG